MKALLLRDEQQGIEHHVGVPPRIYENCGLQKSRIEKAREYVERTLDMPDKRIVELGCGTGDICGPFAMKHRVHAYDCNSESLRVCKERFPSAYTYSNVTEAHRCDTLILCEFLEHVTDPFKIVREWLPLATNVVISHPLNGDLNGDLSGGDHQWSYDEADFFNWFAAGCHTLIEHERFQMGGYEIIIGRGRRA